MIVSTFRCITLSAKKYFLLYILVESDLAGFGFVV